MVCEGLEHLIACMCVFVIHSSEAPQITPHWNSAGPTEPDFHLCPSSNAVCVCVCTCLFSDRDKGNGLSINIHSRTGYGIRLRDLPPGGHRGLEAEGGARAEESLRARGPPAAAAGLPEAALHERGGGQQEVELRFQHRLARKRLQHRVGGAPVPGCASVLPQLHGEARGAAWSRDDEGHEAGVVFIRRGFLRVREHIWVRRWVPGSDHQGVLQAATAKQTQTVHHHRSVHGIAWVQEFIFLLSCFSAELMWHHIVFFLPLQISSRWRRGSSCIAKHLLGSRKAQQSQVEDHQVVHASAPTRHLT